MTHIVRTRPSTGARSNRSRARRAAAIAIAILAVGCAEAPEREEVDTAAIPFDPAPADEVDGGEDTGSGGAGSDPQIVLGDHGAPPSGGLGVVMDR